MSRAAIALGSNLESKFGDRAANLLAAMERMRALGTLVAVSSFRDTAPVGYLEQPRFLNAAAVLETGLRPQALLHALLAIEEAMGRRRSADAPPKGPRVIDLDLLLYDDLCVAEAELVVPHAAMHEREFVLGPLAEIAGEWVHPGLGKTVAELLNG